MSDFKFEHAVTQAFRTSGGKQFGWRLIFWTTAALTIVMLVVLPMILPYYGELLAINQQNMQAILSGNPSDVDNDSMNALFSKMAPAYLLMIGGIWITWVASEAALHRKVLRHQEAPKQPLRLGKDELNVWLAQLGVFGLILAIYIFGIMVLSVITPIFMKSIPILGVLFIVLGVIAFVCILCLAAVRLAPASALSIKDDTPRVLAAKNITKGKFWTLFPAYLVVYITGHVLMYVVMVIGINLVIGDSSILMNMYGSGNVDPRDVMTDAGERLKNPFIMLLAVLSIIAYSTMLALYMVSLIGISSHAVKAWRS